MLALRIGGRDEFSGLGLEGLRASHGIDELIGYAYELPALSWVARGLRPDLAVRWAEAMQRSGSMTKRHKPKLRPYAADDPFAMSDARADYLATHGREPADAELRDFIDDARRRANIESGVPMVTTRAGAPVVTAAGLTVAEAAEFLRCSERTIVRLINRGGLKASKSKGKTLVRRVDLEKLLER